MGLIALLIKIFSRGPVFYRQERMGLGGEPFIMFKFRTMKIGAEDETGPVLGIIRRSPENPAWEIFYGRTSLDELPQLLNVIKGEMSLVGPRPERPIFIERFAVRFRNTCFVIK